MTMISRTEHCYFAKFDQYTGKCIAACHLNDGDQDCVGMEREPHNHTGRHEVPLGMGLKLKG